MTLDETCEKIEKLRELFNNKKEYCNFKAIENPKFISPDLCALNLLQEICPLEDIFMEQSYNIDTHEDRFENIIYADKVSLCWDLDSLYDKITEEQVLYLVRCGVEISDTRFLYL